MSGRIMVSALTALVAVSSFGCTEPPPEPIFIKGPDADVEADGDADADFAGPDDGGECTGEDYPCGPYGNTWCDVVANHGFVPANDAATELAGFDGIFDLSDVIADESVVGILLFGTAGWCTFCSAEAPWLSSLYEEYQDVDGQGHRVEFVAVVYQNDAGGPATAGYATLYGERKGLQFPTVADTQGDILYYFDSQSAPGNILIDATEMRIIDIIQGFDELAIEGGLHQLDGSVHTCD
jgi:thiol-disulfide isomerase/thioredoxin